MTKPAMPSVDQYNPVYFSGMSPGSLDSARVVLTRLAQVRRFASVIDMGVGQGPWFEPTQAMGCTELVGLDGFWVRRDQALGTRIDFREPDLETDLPIDTKRDLAISVEVAEHLSPARSPGFVHNLTLASDVIVFGAAIPKQGGVHHVNERRPSEWAAMFESLSPSATRDA